MHTPLLVDTSTTFEKYISRLSKTDKKKYKKNLKETQDYSFERIEYDSKLQKGFIDLWSRQKVYGKHPNWCYTMKQMDALNLTMFAVTKDWVVATHCLEINNNCAYAHPPLYDKSTPELARYTWFNTIRWCCENKIKYLDMGGGSGCDWPTLIKTRHGNGTIQKRIRYKWAYVPEDVKDNPDTETVRYSDARKA